MKNLVRRAAIASTEIPFGQAQNDTSAIAILKHDLLP